jgi:hypothetical protein
MEPLWVPMKVRAERLTTVTINRYALPSRVRVDMIRYEPVINARQAQNRRGPTLVSVAVPYADPGADNDRG